MLTYIDTHVHLDNQAYQEDLGAVLEAARTEGVRYMVCPGSDRASSERARMLSAEEAGVFYSVGCHPHEAKDCDDAFFDWAASLTADRKLVAIGEVGLDYHYDHSPRDVQRDVFARHIALAKQMGLPLIVHDREAHADTIDILRAEGAYAVGGVLHCFSGSWEMARICLDMGFYISFGGPVTFKNSVRPREVAAKVPLDRLLSETDGPYLAPEPFRGRRNEPKHVVRVVEKLSELVGLAVDETAQALLENAVRLFRFLPEHTSH